MIRSYYRLVIDGTAMDTFVSYTWLYGGSFGLGLLAFLIAMTFRHFPEPEEQPCRV